MATTYYLAVLKKWCEPSLGSHCSMPTHSAHALKFTVPITHEAMGDIATRLVAAERLLTRNTQRFGRVVFLRCSEEGAFGYDTPTGTCLPSSERMTYNPLQLRGLRSEHMAHDCASVTLGRDRVEGSRWSKTFMGALSLSECVPSYTRDPRNPAWALDLAGPTASWCAPWAAWAMGEIPEHTTDVDISDEGVVTHVEPSIGPMFTAYATDNAKLRAWSTRAPLEVRLLWQLERDNDARISSLLREYRRAWLTFDHRWWDGERPTLANTLVQLWGLAGHWKKYAGLLGYSAPGGTWPVSGRSWTANEPIVYQGHQLTLKRHHEPVFELVSYLFQVWAWLPNVVQVRPYGQYDPAAEYWFPKPGWTDYNSYDDWNPDSDSHGDAVGRSRVLYTYRKLPELMKHFWGVVHALNLLEQLIIPANRRALERTSPSAPTVRPSKAGVLPRRVPSVWEFEPYVSIGTAPRDPILTKYAPQRPPETAIAVAPIKPRRQWKFDFSTDEERRGTTDFDAETPEPHEYDGTPGQGIRENLWRKFDAIADTWGPEAKREDWDETSRAAQELARFGDGYDTPDLKH